MAGNRARAGTSTVVAAFLRFSGGPASAGGAGSAGRAGTGVAPLPDRAAQPGVSCGQWTVYATGENNVGLDGVTAFSQGTAFAVGGGSGAGTLVMQWDGL